MTIILSKLQPTICAAVVAFTSVLMAAPVVAQGLPPIYDKTPVEPAPSTTVATFPNGTFLENLAINPRGDLFINSYEEGKVYRIQGKSKPQIWSTIDGTIAGIALNPDGSALLSGWAQGKFAAVFWVDAKGKSKELLRLEGGMFPNGVARLAPNQYLVADSYKGAIWLVDSAKATATVWVEDALLGRASTENPTPAVNGLKIFKGAVYATNTAKQLLIKIPLLGNQPGTLELIGKELGLDDFDFDQNGNLYGATHVYNSLVRVSPDGKVTVIAGLAQGMAGSTAVAARPVKDGVDLYVSTNGGKSLPPEGGVQPGRVVKVHVAVPR